jgi:hypothetical protein
VTSKYLPVLSHRLFWSEGTSLNLGGVLSAYQPGQRQLWLIPVMGFYSPCRQIKPRPLSSTICCLIHYLFPSAHSTPYNLSCWQRRYFVCSVDQIHINCNYKVCWHVFCCYFFSTKATKFPLFSVSLSLIIRSLHEGNVWYQAGFSRILSHKLRN